MLESSQWQLGGRLPAPRNYSREAPGYARKKRATFLYIIRSGRALEREKVRGRRRSSLPRGGRES